MEEKKERTSMTCRHHSIDRQTTRFAGIMRLFIVLIFITIPDNPWLLKGWKSMRDHLITRQERDPPPWLHVKQHLNRIFNETHCNCSRSRFGEYKRHVEVVNVWRISKNTKNFQIEMTFQWHQGYFEMINRSLHRTFRPNQFSHKINHSH